MKAAVVTFLRAYNYGAVLQCYALCKALMKNGIEAEALDYYPYIFREQYRYEKKILIKHPPIKTYIRKQIIKRQLQERNKAFEEFIDNYIPHSFRTIYTYEQLCELTLDADIFIAGSDQVWNDACADFDRVFFLDFPQANRAKKCSYAASFGMSNIPVEKKEKYREYLSNYDSYSVRENSGVGLLKSLGINKPIHVLCDPTVLLTKDEWEAILHPIDEEPYILVYYVAITDSLHKFAIKLSKETGYKIVCVPCNTSFEVLSGKHDRKYGFEPRFNVSPDMLISLIHDAQLVLTNSFHGTIFSALFHKKTYYQISSLQGGKNERILNVLTALKMPINEIFTDTYQYYQWDRVDKELAKMREEGNTYLKNVIPEL